MKMIVFFIVIIVMLFIIGIISLALGYVYKNKLGFWNEFLLVGFASLLASSMIATFFLITHRQCPNPDCREWVEWVNSSCCEKCGWEVTAPTVDCPNCEKEFNPNKLPAFCPDCGTKIKE